MTGLSQLSAPKRLALDKAIELLSTVPDVAAIALGGSHASGRATAESDLDLGLYYREDRPFSIDRIVAVARALSTDPAPIVTGFYEWGPWVNGGAWIQTSSGKVDFLYRNLAHVTRTIDDARLGRIEHDYDQQPPYGFYSVIYLAETKVAIPLRDPDGMLTQLKSRIGSYPEKLKTRIVDQSLWSAEFTLGFATASARTGDVCATVGCLTRVFASLTQALFALNEEYFLSDKHVLDVVRGFGRVPRDYTARVEPILASPGANPETLTGTVTKLRELWSEVVQLTDGNYEPRYRQR